MKITKKKYTYRGIDYVIEPTGMLGYWLIRRATGDSHTRGGTYTPTLNDARKEIRRRINDGNPI